MSSSSAQAAIDAAFALADSLRQRTGIQSLDAAVVCGSGLASIADHLDEITRFDLAELGLPAPKVAGHRSELILARLNNGVVAVFAGRVHLYEGWSVHEVCAQVRLAAAWGAHGVLLTNAAGGINPLWSPGDLVLIEDHINLTGFNPLAGPDGTPNGTSRFVDCSTLYDAEITAAISQRSGVTRKGVYAANFGPSYETPAEVRMAKAMGADLVGMSTVCEAIAARHMGLKIAGISLMTNYAAGLNGEPLSHEEVTATANESQDRLIAGVLAAASVLVDEATGALAAGAHTSQAQVPSEEWCACMGTLSAKQALKDLADEAVELAKEPSKDELSDVVFAVGRLLGSLINKPLVTLPGSRLHVEKISHRMQHHGCVRSVRHLQDGACPSSPV